MALGRTALLAPLARWASGRRFPVLLGLTVALLAIDLVVADPIPLVDEALLTLGVLMLARVRKRNVEDAVSGSGEG